MFENELERIRELYKIGLYDAPFYKRQLKDDQNLKDYADFSSIPFMYKEDIRRSSVFDRTTTEQKDIYGIFSSSGSTGEVTYYVFSKADKKVQTECAAHFLKEVGIDEETLGGVFAPIGTGVMGHTMIWQYEAIGAGYVNCPQPTPENMLSVLEKVPVTAISTRPEVLASVGVSEDYICKARQSAVKYLLPGGGFLCEGKRKYLEDIWAAQCFNFYGMSEVFGPLAGECRCKNGQHYPSQYLMIEVLDPVTKAPVKDGEVGIAVYTTLWKKGFPLLRYWTDDFIRKTASDCSCGSSWPRFFYEGRMSDHLLINDRYLFPKLFEQKLMKYHVTGDYLAEYDGDMVQVIIESHECPSQNLQHEIINFFKCDCNIQNVIPGSLGIYTSHQNHFRQVGV